MPDIAILVQAITRLEIFPNPIPDSQYAITGTLVVEGRVDPIGWDTFVEFDASAQAINKACEDAAIAAALAQGVSVGQHNSKRLFGGAK